MRKRSGGLGVFGDGSADFPVVAEGVATEHGQLTLPERRTVVFPASEAIIAS
jgi:hypothetical protein